MSFTVFDPTDGPAAKAFTLVRHLPTLSGKTIGQSRRRMAPPGTLLPSSRTPWPAPVRRNWRSRRNRSCPKSYDFWSPAEKATLRISTLLTHLLPGRPKAGSPPSARIIRENGLRI